MAAPQLSDRLADPRFGRVLGVLARHRGGNSASVAWQERVAGEVLDEIDTWDARQPHADRMHGGMPWFDDPADDEDGPVREHHGFTGDGLYDTVADRITPGEWADAE